MHIALILYSFQHLSISLYTSAFKDVRATRKLTSPLFHTKLCATDFGQGVVLQKTHIIKLLFNINLHKIVVVLLSEFNITARLVLVISVRCMSYM